MIITPLGHTEFLVDIVNKAGENVRILVDAWLSDYAIGDMMERTVKVSLDPEKLSTIDAIYISHSHTDHFDPYTLMEIYREAQPLLLLPFTLAYLVPLIREYLGDITIDILTPEKPYHLKQVDITGHMFPQSSVTNEDDVMMLSISTDRELLFAEIDTLPEDDHIDVQKALYHILTKREYDTVAYIASRNELEGQLPILDVPAKKRKSYRAEYIARRKDEMHAAYEKYEYEDFEDFPDIYAIPNLVRGFIAQGIGYPENLSVNFARMQIFPLEEIVSMESDIAASLGYSFPQKALLPGRQYRLEAGTIETGRKGCPIGTLHVSHEKGDIETANVRIYAKGSLFPRELSEAGGEKSKSRILDALNHRFLPYWSASPIASLREALVRNGGIYRIGLFLSSRRDPFQNEVGHKDSQNLLSKGKRDSSQARNDKNNECIIFEYSTAGVGFREVSYIEDMLIDETYWLLDVLDFLDGRQELYSNFWHTLDPQKIYRLWTCLGANFCNNDIVLNKYRLHFERAKKGETVNEFVEGVLENL